MKKYMKKYIIKTNDESWVEVSKECYIRFREYIEEEMIPPRCITKELIEKFIK